MNVNVLVLNVFQDFRPADAKDRARSDCDKEFSRSLRNPDAAEEVIELGPLHGTWVEKGSTRASRTAAQSLMREAKALHASPVFTTYGHDGKIYYSTQDKGLRINITA